jgi:hypothetical protein
LEQDLANSIDSLPSVPGFVDLDLSTVCRICSRVPQMKVETATAIVRLFFDRFGAASVVLLSSIECGSIGDRSLQIIAPFLALPLLREAVHVCAYEAGAIEVDWEGTAKNEKEKNAFLQQTVTDLQNIIAQLRASLTAPSARGIPHPERLNGDIIDALKRGDTESVAFLLSKDPSLHAKKEERGWTPLHWSAAYGHPETASLLLQSGADFEAKSNLNFSLPILCIMSWLHSSPSRSIQRPNKDRDSPYRERRRSELEEQRMPCLFFISHHYKEKLHSSAHHNSEIWSPEE